uniref:Uncharacterized protein n=2 Tax=Meloidogyne TaxID=189290 RepID=A0A6V7WEB3_MELEN|nr:unnamed protein product [Meloidogyne enterolobii]
MPRKTTVDRLIRGRIKQGNETKRNKKEVRVKRAEKAVEARKLRSGRTSFTQAIIEQKMKESSTQTTINNLIDASYCIGRYFSRFRSRYYRKTTRTA